MIDENREEINKWIKIDQKYIGFKKKAFDLKEIRKRKKLLIIYQNLYFNRLK